MKTFRDLKVWEKAHQLTLEIYKATNLYPKEEKFGIVSQLRRAVASIPTNIAEGFKRRSKKDFAHFVNMAESSLEEVKYLLLLSRDLRYIDKSKFSKIEPLCDEVGRMLNGLYKSLCLDS